MRVACTQRQKSGFVRASGRDLREVAVNLPVLTPKEQRRERAEFALGVSAQELAPPLDSPVGLNLFASKFQPFTLNTFVPFRCPQCWPPTLSLRLKKPR